ncbi:MAG TPA: universal stress protein [Acidimicrobiales bacterium]
MASPVLLCTDGSDLSLRALAVGRALLDPDAPVVVVTVMDSPDPALLSGTGTAGGVVSAEEFDAKTDVAAAEARAIVADARERLGLGGAEAYILGSEPGDAICRLASEVSAPAIVVGSRGNGGLRRAVLGSVSDHLVRHAPCPVIVTGDNVVADDG